MVVQYRKLKLIFLQVSWQVISATVNDLPLKTVDLFTFFPYSSDQTTKDSSSRREE
jgi:hypothetical protein